MSDLEGLGEGVCVFLERMVKSSAVIVEDINAIISGIHKNNQSIRSFGTCKGKISLKGMFDPKQWEVLDDINDRAEYIDENYCKLKESVEEYNRNWALVIRSLKVMQYMIDSGCDDAKTLTEANTMVRKLLGKDEC